MDYIFITLKAKSSSKRDNWNNLDLKIPGYLTGEEFLKILPEIADLAINEKTTIQAEPLGRILDNGQSFFEEGVGNGAILTLLV